VSTLDDDAMYHRRRADEQTDQRIDRVSRKVDELDAKVDVLTVRVMFIGSIVGPIIASGFIR
jgi:outer membrane murein-binding lipoprotein Lpp